MPSVIFHARNIGEVYAGGNLGLEKKGATGPSLEANNHLLRMSSLICRVLDTVRGKLSEVGYNSRAFQGMDFGYKARTSSCTEIKFVLFIVKPIHYSSDCSR